MTVARRLIPDRRLRTEASGSILLGGHPFRVLKLSPSGAAAVRRLFADSTTDEAPPEREAALATRLLDSGMAHPAPRPAARTCHVVIPFRGPIDELTATLGQVRAQGAASITVVDDGNATPVRLDDGITVLRHDEGRGPAAARNTGWEHVVSSERVDPDDLVVFVDAGVTVEDGVLDALGGHFADPSVGAAAPRVTTTSGPSIIDRYEAIHSPLDLGGDPSSVGPDRPITYVPTACLAVRASLVTELGGFDEGLRYGEDVDFVWRLSGVASVRYDPSIHVHHPARPTLPGFVEQRLRYASAAAALASRHPGKAQTWKANLLGVAGVAITWTGHPLIGLGVGFLPAHHLSRRLSSTATPLATSIRLLALGQGWAMRSFAENMARSWFVPAALVATRSPLARPARRWIIAGWARRLTTTTDPILVALGVIDDVAYGCGVFLGAWRQRSLRALLPEIRRW